MAMIDEASGGRYGLIVVPGRDGQTGSRVRRTRRISNIAQSRLGRASAAMLWSARRMRHLSRVPVALVKDLSKLPLAEFWLTLENNRWTYPYNALGQRVPFREMREHIWNLEDDEYRSLSASVRDAGGYAKTSVPLEEFRWADFFRHKLPAPKNDAEFDALVRKAVELAKSEAALGLPGCLG